MALGLAALGFSTPAQDTGLIARALARRDVRWVTAPPNAYFQLYAIQNGYAAAHLRELTAAAIAARARNLALLGDGTPAAYPARVRLLFVPSRELMRSLVGWPAGGWGVTPENGAFFVATDTLSPAMHHELMHVFSWNLWGAPFGGPERGQWLSEGLAVTASPGGCHAVSLHAIAAAYGRAGRLVSWKALEKFDVSGLAMSAEAGSVVQWVRDRYGVGAVKVLWQSGVPGLSRKTGESAQALEAAWRASLKSAGPLPRAMSVDAFAALVRREGCE